MRPLFLVLTSLLFAGLQAEANPPNLFISDGDNVDVFDGSTLNTNFITSINSASGLALGPTGTLYVASLDDAQVYSYNAATGALTGTFVPFLGSQNSASVEGPEGMAFGVDMHLYIADVTASAVHAYNSAGTSLGTFGSTSLGQPTNVAFDTTGHLFAVDNNGVEKLNTLSGQFDPYIQAISGGGSYVLNAPSSVAFSSTGDTFVLDISGSSPGILKFTGNTFDSQIVNFGSADFVPSDLVIGPDGKLYVSGNDLDNAVGEVLSFNADGSGETVYASGLNNPTFMSFGVPEPSGDALLVCGVGVTLFGTSRRRVVAR